MFQTYPTSAPGLDLSQLPNLTGWPNTAPILGCEDEEVTVPSVEPAREKEAELAETVRGIDDTLLLEEEMGVGVNCTD